MSVDITNGGLNFSSDLDPTGFAQGAKTIVQKENEIRKAVEAGTKQNQIYSDEMLRASTLSKYSSSEKLKAALANTNANKSETLSIAELNAELQKQKALALGTTNPQNLKRLNQTIQETQLEINRLSNVGKAGFDDLGNKIEKTTTKTGGFATGAQKAFNAVRVLANILPGIGIAGLLAFAVGPIIEFISKLDIFKAKISQLKLNTQALNEVNRETFKSAGEQISSLKLLYNASTDVTLSTENRIKAAKELQKLFPDTFKNVKIETILTGDLRKETDELTNSILANARAVAAKNKLAEIESKRLDIATQVGKIKNANTNENARAKNVSVDAFTGPTIGQASGSVGITAGDVVKANNARAAAAIKEQQILDNRLKGQADFLIKYVGQAKLIEAVKTPDKKTSTAKADALLKQEENLEQAIFDLKAKYNNKFKEQDDIEKQIILDDFKKLYTKVANAKAKGVNVDTSGLEEVKTKAIADLTFKQDTAKEDLIFEQQKQLYQDYEDFKTVYSAEAAKQRFGTEVKTNTDLLQELKVKAQGLTAIPEKDRSANQKDRLEQYAKQIKGLEDLDLKRFEKILQAARTFADKERIINEDFEQQKLDLLAATNGKATAEQIKNLENQKNLKLKNLNEENAFALSGLETLLENIDGLTREKALEALEKAKQVYVEQYKSKLITAKEYQSKIALIEGEQQDLKSKNPFVNALDAIKKYKAVATDASKSADDVTKASKNMYGEIGAAAEAAGAIFGATRGILEGLGIGTDKYTQATLDSVQGLIGGIGDLSRGLASGNPIDIIKGSIAILTNAIELFNVKDKKLERQIDGYKANLESLGKAFEALDRAVQNSVGESIYKDQAAQIENLKKQQAELIKARDAESQKKKGDQAKVDEYNKQIAAIPNQIADIEKAISENLIQGSFKDLANTLADALTDAFKAGEDGLDALDSSFNAFIGNAIKNSLKLKLLEPIIKALTDDLVAYAKGNGNSIIGFDFTKYKSDLKNAGELFTGALEANKEFFTDAAGSAKQGNLSQSIKGITADQADRLAGEFGGLRLSQLELVKMTSTNHFQSMQILGESLKELVKIERNTYRTADNTERLAAIQASLESLDKKTSDAKLRGAGIGP